MLQADVGLFAEPLPVAFATGKIVAELCSAFFVNRFFSYFKKQTLIKKLSMHTGYKIYDKTGLYFLTFQVINWVDVFTRKRYKDIIIESLNYCIANKSLNVHAWVIMSNHLHAIFSHPNDLSSVIRDFKTFTSKTIVRSILEMPESRRDWMMFQFNIKGKINRRNNDYQFWTHENHPVQLTTVKMIDARLNYIHENPVRAGLVSESIHYLYSSAMDYADQKGLVPIVKIN